MEHAKEVCLGRIARRLVCLGHPLMGNIQRDQGIRVIDRWEELYGICCMTTRLLKSSHEVKLLVIKMKTITKVLH